MSMALDCGEQIEAGFGGAGVRDTRSGAVMVE